MIKKLFCLTALQEAKLFVSVTLGGGGKALCEILTATGAMPLPMVDPRAGYGWRYDTRYR